MNGGNPEWKGIDVRERIRVHARGRRILYVSALDSICEIKGDYRDRNNFGTLHEG